MLSSPLNRVVTFLAPLLALAGLWTTPLEAEEFRLSPSLTLKEEYNDNIFLDSKDRRSDFISTLSPGLELFRRSERLETQLTARLDGKLYARGNGPDALDQSYRARMGFQVTPRVSLSVAGGYLRDSQPDRDLETTGLSIGAQQRVRQDGQFSAQFGLTEETSASLSYGYSQDRFDSSTTSDITSHNVSLILTRDLQQLLPLTQGRVTLGYGNYQFSTSGVENWTLMVGASRALNELWSLQADLGANYTSSEQTVQQVALVNGKKHSDQLGWAGRLSLVYSGELLSGNLAFSHDVSAASGRNGATERTSLSLEISRRLSWELSARFSASYYINNADKGELSSTAIDEQTVNAGVGLSWQMNRDIRLEAGYQFIRIMYGETGQDADRHSLYTRLVMNWPLFQ